MAATGFKMADFGQKIHTRTYKICRSSVNMASNHLKFYGEHRYMLRNRKIATLLGFSGLSCCFGPSFQIPKIDRKWKFWLFFVVYKGSHVIYHFFANFTQISNQIMRKCWKLIQSEKNYFHMLPFDLIQNVRVDKMCAIIIYPIWNILSLYENNIMKNEL